MCDGKRLGGAKFALYDDCGHEIATAFTDKDGELIFGDLPCGKYFVKELCAPEGYLKNEGAAEVVICGGNLNRTVEFVNTRITGSIRIIKYGV